MSLKFVFIIFGTLLLTQCILANNNEEAEHPFLKMINLHSDLADEIIVSLQNNFEPIFNDLQNNKITVEEPLKGKLKELKASLTPHPEHGFLILDFVKEFTRLYLEIHRILILKTKPTDGRYAVANALTNTGNYLKEKITKLAEGMSLIYEEFAQIEPKYVKLQDQYLEIKNEEHIVKKISLLYKTLLD